MSSSGVGGAGVVSTFFFCYEQVDDAVYANGITQKQRTNFEMKHRVTIGSDDAATLEKVELLQRLQVEK